MIIYRAICKVNGKAYIGQTIQSFAARRRQHEKDARCGAKQPFQRALRKYGADAFEWEILARGKSIDELNDLEAAFIALHKTNNKRMGYNADSGGKNAIPNAETRAKLSVALRGKNRGKTLSTEHRAKIAAGTKKALANPETRAKLSAAQRGRKHSIETRRKISENNRGKKMSPEARHKISEARKRRPPASAETLRKISEAMRGENNPFFGKKHSAESRAKIGTKRRGRTHSAETLRKMSEARRGKSKSAEHRAKIGAAQRGKKMSPESIAKTAAANRGKTPWNKGRRMSAQANIPQLL